MTYAQPDAPRPIGSGPKRDGDGTLETWFGARARRILGTIGLVVLVALLALSAGRSPQAPGLSDDRGGAARSLEDGRQPVFDGRGKWTGYAR